MQGDGGLLRRLELRVERVMDGGDEPDIFRTAACP